MNKIVLQYVYKKHRTNNYEKEVNMAKKFGKFLAFTAIATAVGAGAVALYKKYVAQKPEDDFDDFDDYDFDDDFEDDFDTDLDRGYTAIPLETDAVDEALGEAKEEEKPADDKKADDTAKKDNKKA